MRKLLISYLLVSAALPATAQVDMAIHRLCSDTKDYEGCVKTQMSMKNEDNSTPIKEVKTGFKDLNLTPWEKYLVENPSLKEWVEANPTLGEKKKKEWEDKIGDKASQCPEGYYFHIAAKECVFYNKAFLEDNTNDSATSRLNCPAGKDFYQTQGILGMGKRDIGCLTPYEAESLRQQSDQNALNSINNSLQNIRNSAQQPTYNVTPQVPTYRPPVRCTTSLYPGLAQTMCY